jgi:lipopolysaccharide transport system ATP-binding protein
MRTKEIASRLDAIIDFAGVATFIDTPVKRYSSGMQARLGFSIAAHLEPDVLLIDEVLAVGDASFQAKCFDRMRAFKEAGTAIMFVSHNLHAIAELCDRAVYLRRSIQAEGSSEEAIAAYLSSMRSDANISKPGGVRIGAARLTDAAGDIPKAVRPGTPLSLKAEYRMERDFTDVTFAFRVYRSTDHLVVYEGHFPGVDIGLRRLKQGQLYTLRFDFLAHLARGQYHVELYVDDGATGEHVAWRLPAAFFHVQQTETFSGIADLKVGIALTKETPTAFENSE